MNSDYRRFRRVLATGMFLVAWLIATGPVLPVVANEVVQWNEIALKVIVANGQSPVVVTRSLAMVHAAVHDVLNAISRRYDAYYFEGPADPGAAVEAAVGAAAHTVLVGVIPDSGSPAQKERRWRWSRRPSPRPSPECPTDRQGIEESR